MFNLQVTKRGPASLWPQLRNSLISYWRLDEGSGTRIDAFGSNNLADNNTVEWNTGRVGNAASFTFSNSEYLSIDSNSSLQTGDIDFTFAGWFYPLTTRLAGNDILGKMQVLGTGSEYFIEIYELSGTHFRFRVVGAGDLDNVESIPLNAWTFFVCWHDSVGNKLNYQLNNGEIKSVSTTGAPVTDVYPFKVGIGVQTGGDNRFFDGRIDELGFWKRILTSAERTFLYNKGNGTTII